ncbi:putative nucleoside diphosphatase [Aureobasidium pullulans]|nr:putative nucleoside diphosphatase [Aureobasidium pullulans]
MPLFLSQKTNIPTGRYGVILDAGSSGTRVHIYRWLNTQRARKEGTEVELNSLPELETKKKWTLKIHPGVSTFGEKPEAVGPDHLKQLVDHALEYIPDDQVQDTPIFLLATAGMRLLPDIQRNQVLDNICSYLQRNTQFQLPDCGLHIQVIPGETEGLYGWIAANYLLGAFDADAAQHHGHGKDHHTYGFLDMGGASAQIAFAPNATEAEKHAEDLKLLRMRKVNGDPLEYKVFVTTWLGYGVNEARRRYIDSLLTASPGIAELPDPCLPTGLEVTKSGHAIGPGSHEAAGKETYLLGTGKFPECLSKTFPLLDKDAPCLDPPCLLHGVHVPAIDFDVNHFVGVSEYWHTTHEIFEMAHKDKAYDFNTYQQRVLEFCSQDWKSIQKGVKEEKWGHKVTEEKVAEVCFKASWLINMLHDGIGIPRVGLEATKGGHNGTKAVIDGAKEKGFLDPFQAVNKINDVEVSWTLGKMVLYAASQVPGPDDKALAVGFGSNVAGPNLPKDFQYAGGSSIPLPSDLKDDDVDWHDKLFTSSSSRRLPGFLLFLLILLVAAFLLCGRDRRSSLLRKAGFSPGKGNKRKNAVTNGLGKLFGNNSSGPSYERVLEGGIGPDPSDFELDDMNDSDSENSNGHTSGWATPKANNNGFSSPVLHCSPRSARVNLYNANAQYPPPQPMAGYFDGPPNHASSTHSLATTPGLQLPGGRGGLLARTESREQLATATLRSGSRSRAASPSRIRSPFIAPLREGIE